MKENIMNEIKTLGKELNFQIIRSYDEKYFRATNPMRDQYLFLHKPNNKYNKKSRKFTMQKFGKRFRKLLYR